MLSKKIKYKISLVMVLLTALTGSGCKKWVEIPGPYTSTNSENVFQNDATAASVLTGLYGKLSAENFGAVNVPSLSLFGGLSSDEFTLYSGFTNNIQLISCYRNTQSNLNTIDMWSNAYPYIFTANAAIEGLNASTTLSPAVKKQLLGEAKFMRAFFYFYMVNLYGDVPLVLSTDYKQSSTLPRTAQAVVYQQVISDLKDAEGLMAANYVESDALSSSSSTERVRPSKWAAVALLARVYLYTGQWANAEAQANVVIGNTGLFGLSSLPNAFLKYSSGNKEAIWQLQPVKAGYNTQDARLFLIPPTGPSTTYFVYLSNNLVSSFEVGDQRKSSWTNNVTVSGTTYYSPYKYKISAPNQPSNEYTMVLRLAEQYLIRAEAKAQLGEASATDDLNAIRSRAGLPNYAGATDKTSLLAAIMHERQVELLSEWGHRWFDLKRTQTIDQVMSAVTPQKSANSWNSIQQFYPLSQKVLADNPALVQNPGY